MDSAMVIFILIILQNILDCNGISLTDQLVQLLRNRRDQDYPEDYQIYIRSQDSPEEESEETTSQEDEVVDEPAEYVAYDKPIARVIRDYYKIEQANKKKKMQIEQAFHTKIHENHVELIRKLKKRKKGLHQREMQPVLNEAPPTAPPRSYQIREELYPPPLPPPPQQYQSTFVQNPAPPERQYPVKKVPRYVKPPKFNQASTIKFREKKHESSTETPAQPLTVSPVETRAKTVEGLITKQTISPAEKSVESPEEPAIKSSNKQLIKPPMESPLSISNEVPQDPYYEVARTGSDRTIITEQPETEKNIQHTVTEDTNETDSQIIDLLGIGYDSKYEITGTIDSLILDNDTTNSFLPPQDAILKDVNWNKHRRQTDINLMLSSCKLVIVPSSRTDLESDITKLLEKYNTPNKKIRNLIIAIVCSEKSNIVILKANEIIIDLILILASSGHISCHCQRNNPITRRNYYISDTVKNDLEMRKNFRDSHVHKFNNIAPENLILRKSQSKYSQTDSVPLKKKLLQTLKSSKETEVDAALLSEILTDAQTPSNDELQGSVVSSMLYKSVLPERIEASKNNIPDSNLKSIYAKDDKENNEMEQMKETIENMVSAEQSNSNLEAKWKRPARMQLLKKKYAQTQRRQPQINEMQFLDQNPEQAPFAPPTFDDIVDMKYGEELITKRKETTPQVMKRADNSPELRLLRSEVQNIKNSQKEEMAKIQLELAELRNTIKLCNKKVEELEAHLDPTRQAKKLTSRASALGQLEETVMKLEQDIHERERELFSTDLEIMNIPEKRGEDLINIVQELTKTLGVIVETRDIVFVDREGPNLDGVDTMPEAARQRPKQPSIIVRLSRRRLRDEIVRRARLHRNATPGVLVRERLTESDKELFRLTRQTASSRGWKFIWTKQGHILAKQSAKHPTYNIRSEADIERIFSKAITKAASEHNETNTTLIPGRQIKQIGNDMEMVAQKESPSGLRPTYEIRFDPNHKTYIDKNDIHPVAK